MLQIHKIHKQYKTGDLVQTALDGVSLTLRDNEFVAILGPSGSGKTTLLNVIGGLDRYDSGDLVINGISTRKYSDRDWDSYRNHTIGFVFQSYNLIPHQTVLANVELALTISGISRSERKKRAKKALEDVGLGDQVHKKPNQMSGGQMQRVAIARALVNNPDILLADEPTGALDSETSVQVMELLKAVSKDRLVVMVTHNPELAEEYANRIVRVRDGRIIDDSNPYTVNTEGQEQPKHKNMGKASMSFLTALSLSFNNLRTKKGRTILTAFAGSIGIIGIALIMSLSTGFQNYIDKIQEDTLSNYPLSIQSETADMTAALAAFGSAMAKPESVEDGTVLEQQMMSQMFAQIGSNDLGSFKAHFEEHYSEVAQYINSVRYSYGIRPNIYSANTQDGIVQVNPGNLFGSFTEGMAFSSYMSTDVFYEMMDNISLLSSQYDVLQGRWPVNENEMILVLSDPNQITDYMAYTLGLKNADGLMQMIQQVMSGNEVESTEEPMKWTYDDLFALDFRLVHASSKYQYNAEYGVWENMSGNKAFMESLIQDGDRLQIVGIVCPKDGSSATMLSPGVAYTSALTKKVIAAAQQSDIVTSQLENMQVDVFTGKPFGAEEDTDSGLNFENMISVDKDMISAAFGMDVDEDAIMYLMKDYMQNIIASLDIDTTPAQQDFLQTFSVMAKDMFHGFIQENTDPQTGVAILRMSDAEAMIDSYLSSDNGLNAVKKLENKYQLSDGTLSLVYKPLLFGMVAGYIADNMAQPELPEIPEVTIPGMTLPAATAPTESAVEESAPTTHETVVPVTDGNSAEDQTVTVPIPELTQPLEQMYAQITADDVDTAVESFMEYPLISGTATVISGRMMLSTMQDILTGKLAGFGNVLMNYFGSALRVDEAMLSSAFHFNMNEEDLRRLMDAMSGTQKERSAELNLSELGYADLSEPSAISVYFTDFAGKEVFLDFLDGYNERMKADGKEDQIISYTDLTGVMMSSVRTIIDSVSYVLIAFVAVSLIVSSIMIGIITYISVMERTKEIGVLRAIGASKRNISQVFNAETFIIGLCSGLIGVGITVLLNVPINKIIFALTDNPNIHAQLPVFSGIVLILLSMLLTLIGGLIPSKHAARKDPVIALRSE